MTKQASEFIWYELMTSDVDAARRFYGPVIGWTVGNQPDYAEIQAMDGDHVGGMLQLTDEMTSGGARPAWVAYISVEDVDASVASIEAAGGRCHMPPRDMEGVGRFAMVADPQGAPFYVMKPTPPADRPDAQSNAFARYEPMQGHCAWNELSTSDPEAARQFYNRQFGWVKDGEMDMGPMGKYEFLQFPGERPYPIGAVMEKMPHMPVSAWTFYFRAADIDEGAAAIAANGGAVILDPVEIPGGDYSLVATDPQGAVFGLVGPRQ